MARDLILSGNRWSVADTYRALHERALLAEAVAELFRRVDVLLLPTVPWLPTVDEVLADPLGTNRRLGRLTHFANLLRLAANPAPVPVPVPVPWTTRSHPAVPLGVSVLAPSGRAGLVADVALRLTGGSVPVPVPSSGPPRSVEAAVVGAHLAGFPLNGQLTEPGGVLLERTRTAPICRLHRLAGGPVARRALERVGQGWSSIEVEVGALPVDALGRSRRGWPAARAGDRPPGRRSRRRRLHLRAGRPGGCRGHHRPRRLARLHRRNTHGLT